MATEEIKHRAGIVRECHEAINRREVMDKTAELLEAAEYFAKHQYCECDYSVGVKNCMGCDIDRMARHILSTVHPDDDEPVTVESLRQQLADVTAERDRLLAELLQQPPTLEWLRGTFGSQPEVTVQSTGYDAYGWSCGVKYREPYGRVSCSPGNLCKTRAAVLAAVVETKIESEVT